MVLAGKYGQLLNAAAKNPGGAIAVSALGAGLLGSTGSAIGNLVDKEKEEGSLRIASESLSAGLLSSLPGVLTGLSAATLGMARQPGVLRSAVKKAGSAAPVRNAVQKVAGIGALATAGIPVAAGLGGLIGGGGSHFFNAIGIPGNQTGINPESYGSSNARAI